MSLRRLTPLSLNLRCFLQISGIRGVHLWRDGTSVTCDLPCDEGKIAQETDRALEGLQSVFSGFDPAKVKGIKVRELAEGCAVGVRGFYDFPSGTVTLCCVNGKVCVETLVHELLHSNSFTKRRTWRASQSSLHSTI